mgnify:CR=1 FL=1
MPHCPDRDQVHGINILQYFPAFNKIHILVMTCFIIIIDQVAGGIAGSSAFPALFNEIQIRIHPINPKINNLRYEGFSNTLPGNLSNAANTANESPMNASPAIRSEARTTPILSDLVFCAPVCFPLFEMFVNIHLPHHQ